MMNKNTVYQYDSECLTKNIRKHLFDSDFQFDEDGLNLILGSDKGVVSLSNKSIADYIAAHLSRVHGNKEKAYDRAGSWIANTWLSAFCEEWDEVIEEADDNVRKETEEMMTEQELPV